MVNEDPVEPDKGRVGTHIRPGVLAVAKGKLDEPESVDSVVKELGLRGREVVIVPIRGMASEVEVPGDDPRDLISRVVSREVLEELGLSGRHTGGINIGETKPTVITVDSKVRGEDVA
jgi:8-oxo-dGTP pyrophosphatase MutT (NUDIX family)